MRYEVFPLVAEHGQFNIPDEVLAGIWNTMVAEGKAQKVFYNGYVTSVYDFINFLKTGGVIAILIGDNETNSFCHIAWISDYGEGHACLHHCSLGKFKRGAAKAILAYYGQFKNSTGEPTFESMIGITPENNEAAVRVARLMGFKMLSPTIPMLCNDVYAGQKVGGVISYYQYERGDTSWAAAEKAEANQAA